MELQVIGWLGAACLALCGLPQAIMSVRQKHSDGISVWLLYLWAAGEVLTFIYVSPKFDWPLIFNYWMNLLFLGIILWYKHFPRR